MKKYNEAINMILQTLGEQTIDDVIYIEGNYEAEQADLLLEITKREVLSEGWSFNTDNNWKLLPDSNGYITLPVNLLSFDASNTADNYIANNGALYDKDSKTRKFTSGVELDIVWELDFDDIPLPCQTYIIAKTSRNLYQRLVGDLNVVSLLRQDEQEALMKLREYDDSFGDYNIFDDQSVSRAISRTSNPVGIRG